MKTERMIIAFNKKPKFNFKFNIALEIMDIYGVSRTLKFSSKTKAFWKITNTHFGKDTFGTIVVTAEPIRNEFWNVKVLTPKQEAKIKIEFPEFYI